MNILVSACLLGVACRYDGKSKPNEKIINLMKNHNLIPVCPEELGGLTTPRLPAEIKNNEVIRKDNKNITKEYLLGANEALKIARLYKCKIAILKAKSPSCGSSFIYDGNFSGNLIKGQGITCKILRKNNIKVLNENFKNLYED